MVIHNVRDAQAILVLPQAVIDLGQQHSCCEARVLGAADGALVLYLVHLNNNFNT